MGYGICKVRNGIGHVHLQHPPCVGLPMTVKLTDWLTDWLSEWSVQHPALLVASEGLTHSLETHQAQKGKGCQTELLQQQSMADRNHIDGPSLTQTDILSPPFLFGNLEASDLTLVLESHSTYLHVLEYIHTRIHMYVKNPIAAQLRPCVAYVELPTCGGAYFRFRQWSA